MRRHHTLRHAGGGSLRAVAGRRDRMNKDLRRQFMQHSVDGLPKCKHCLKEFSG